MVLAMRCNCQMSFSSSFERPSFTLRSHRKRTDKTNRIGRPMASVPSTMRKSSESRGVRGCIDDASKCRLLEAGYRSATVVTNQSTSGPAVKRPRLFLDSLDLALFLVQLRHGSLRPRKTVTGEPSAMNAELGCR